MFSFWKFFITKQSFSYLLLVVLVGFGFVSLASIPRESAPEVRVPVGIVTTILQGANAEDVEILVTDELEQGLISGLDDVKKITSTSSEGVSSIVVEFEASADLDESIRSLQDEVDRLRRELPSEAEDPIVSDVNFVDQPISSIAISSDLPEKEFAELAREVKERIESVRGVSKVTVSGLRDREVTILLDQAKLATLGLTITNVSQAIAQNNIELPVGSLTVNDVEYSVSFAGNIDDPATIADLPLFSVGNEAVYIRDIGKVVDDLEEEFAKSRISIDGSPSKQSLVFNTYKQTGGDITKIAEAVRTEFQSLQDGDILQGAEVLVVYDSGELIEEDLANLTKTGLQTIFLVMLVLFVAIGWRESLIAGSAIPLSFLIAFIGLKLSDNTLNFVSLFALILAVGVIVDSTIVIVEGIHTRMKQWMEKKEAAISAIAEYNIPLLSGTLTTISVFAALFIVGGVTGEFIASIPATIIFLLTASLFVALGIIPLFAASLLRRRSESKLEKLQEVYMEKLQGWYKRQLSIFLGNKIRENLFLIVISAGFVFSLALPIVGAIPVIFFSQGDADQLIVELELPEGTPLTKTDIEARRVEEFLYTDPRFESFATTIGEGSQFVNGGSGSNLANIFITLRDDRKQISSEILEELRTTLSVIKTATIRISQPSDGPPVGSPILIKFKGNDLDELDKVAQEASLLLASIPETTNTTTSAKDVGVEFVLDVDRARAAEFGLTASQIASLLRTSVEGITATTIAKQGSDIDVTVKLNLNPGSESLSETTIATIDALENISLPTQQGNILLGSVLTVRVDKKSSTVSHEDGDRVVTVTSDVVDGAPLAPVLAQFQDKISEENLLTNGVTMEIGGENEETNEAFIDMFLALILGIAGMLAILVLQFNSFRYAGYVLSVLPFSLIGIFIGLLVSGKAISFPSLMGFVALSGIVVNNSIILIDVMNNLRERNPAMSIHDVVVEGATSRLRPILLTTITTVIGIFPLTFASELWAPLAYAIMFGLSFSVVITLILIPIIYSRWPGKLGTEKDTEKPVSKTEETMEDFTLA